MPMNQRGIAFCTLPLLLLVLLLVSGWSQTAGSAAPGRYVPEGTSFIVKLDDKLDTNKLKPGKKFNVKLAEDLIAPDGNTIPRNKKIRAHVSQAGDGMRGRLLLTFTEIETRKGWVPIAATVIDVPGEKSVKINGEEGEIERRGSSGARIAQTAAIGAGVGAAAGAVAGGMKGAAIGAAAGAAVGGGASLLMAQELVLEKGQQLELRLDRPIQIPR
ncbi:MAG: hypothetical protein AB7V46_18460 [Thermomicrobiales bacterium]